ncbi:MAG TPA: autotransporter-associated beta strand repeat-containing protein [Verrucomicrobiales bacterium]|nr:autotransporter-associated beta strand repeat-containing protein [Verrucomicrobiales bacterium]
MKPTLQFTNAILPLLIAGAARATDYTTVVAGIGDASNPATWSPSAAPIIAGGNITPLAGDRLLIAGAGGDNLAGGSHLNGAGQIIINSGASLIQSGTAKHNIQNHIEIAGTGTDGLGAFQNLGNDWADVSDVRLSNNALIRIESGGWRHDDHGTGRNIFDLNGKTLSVTGANSWYFVNTNVTGGGVINVDIRGEFNFEASSVLPANTTLNLLNTRSSSWDGAGRTMAGNINMTNSILETRQNDANKTFTGTIGLTGTGTFRTNTDNGSIGNHQQINGQVTGTGRLIKDGTDATGIVFLNNPTNNYTGGTTVNAGTLQVGAAGAIPAGSEINVNGGSLNLGTFTQQMGSGTIGPLGTVTGAGTLVLSGAGTKTINPGATINNTGGVQLSGGVLSPTGTNALAGITGTLSVTGNSTLRPQQDAPVPGLKEFHRSGPDLAGDIGTTGAIFSGVTDGIPAIDSTAKPFGDNNAFIYTGQILNTTGANIDVTFGEQYDDQIRVKIDGTTRQFDTGWNTATASGVVTLSPGAHDIEISSFDGVGGAGPNSGWDKGVGIRVGPYTITDVNGGGDNAAFNKINIANLNAIGLTIRTGAIPGSLSETKALTIAAGVSLTVDTSGMAAGNTYTMSGGIGGTGNLVKAGAGALILTGITTTTGTATVNQGTLTLNGTHSFSSISVASGATVNGSGSAASAAMNVAAGGHVAPGNSPGTMTVGNVTMNGAYDAEIGGAAAGQIDHFVTSATIWNAGSSVNVTLLNGYDPAPGTTFDIHDGTNSGTTPAFNLPALSGGKSWNTSNFMNNGTLSVVPEPSSMLLGALGLGFLLRRRR